MKKYLIRFTNAARRPIYVIALKAADRRTALNKATRKAWGKRAEFCLDGDDFTSYAKPIPGDIVESVRFRFPDQIRGVRPVSHRTVVGDVIAHVDPVDRADLVNMARAADAQIFGLGPTVNGFTFNLIGELVAMPDSYTLRDLKRVHHKLIAAREHIKASRINHLIRIEAGL